MQNSDQVQQQTTQNSDQVQQQTTQNSDQEHTTTNEGKRLVNENQHDMEVIFQTI